MPVINSMTLRVSSADISPLLAYSIVRGQFSESKGAAGENRSGWSTAVSKRGTAYNFSPWRSAIERRVKGEKREGGKKRRKGFRRCTGKKERENVRPRRDREKGEQQLHEIQRRRAATRNLRHKSNDPPANFAGIALLPWLSEGRDPERERGRERFSLFPGRANRRVTSLQGQIDKSPHQTLPEFHKYLVFRRVTWSSESIKRNTRYT